MVAYALRHRPDAFGLILDDSGWVMMRDLVAALSRHDQKWQDLTASDIRAAAAASSKQRFEFADDRVRALYGHSVPKKIAMAPADPPEILFHGTTLKSLAEIRRTGLQPMSRQYVHLSPDVKTATRVASRRTRHPIILKVLASRAARDGAEFYYRNASVWLSNSISREFIEFPESE